MNVAARIPAPLDSRFRGNDVIARRNDGDAGTTKFGMLRSAMGLVQAAPNACDVSSTRFNRPSVVTTNKRDQEV